MGQDATLVRLFWQQLVRRKSLWIVVALAGLMLLAVHTIQSQMDDMLREGVRYDIASRRAAAALEGTAEQIRTVGVIVVLVLGALVAPGSRRDGTTQFVLTLSVSRSRLARAQFGALALFLLLGSLVVHGVYMLEAYRLGVLRVSEALLAWPLLVLPLLLVAATSFSLSLTRPAMLVYAVLLGVPYILVPLLGAFVHSWDPSIPRILRLLAARLLDNLDLLFPRLSPLVLWPHLNLPTPERPPFPAWGLESLHAIAATAFWVVAGAWAYRRHDFGSRMPTK